MNSGSKWLTSEDDKEFLPPSRPTTHHTSRLSVLVLLPKTSRQAIHASAETSSFDMIVEPATDGGVRFRSVLALREEREPIEFLDPTIERDHTAAPISLCGWCGRGRLDDSWMSLAQLDADLRLSERPAPPPVATGICDPCKEQMSKELRDQGVDGVAPT